MKVFYEQVTEDLIENQDSVKINAKKLRNESALNFESLEERMTDLVTETQKVIDTKIDGNSDEGD